MKMDLTINNYICYLFDAPTSITGKHTYIIFKDNSLFTEIRDTGGREGGPDEWGTETEDRYRPGLG